MYLDGATPPAERERRVAKFQAGEADLFLISLRAGGTGLNLTAADYVVHLDPWWNPAVEDQASDRAHRIGQTRPVTIYRLVMADSIEQRIVELHAAKRDLAADLLEGADAAGRLTERQLLELIGG
jgi:SNF2 family DNA or RNA helicase